MNDDLTILEYNEIFNPKISSISKRILIFFLIILIGGLIVISKFNYYQYKKIILFYDGNNTYKASVNIYDLDKISNIKTIIINNKKYSYKVIRIDEDIIIDGEMYYKNIYLKTNIPNNYKIKNNVLSANIEVAKGNIYNNLVKFMRGEN